MRCSPTPAGSALGKEERDPACNVRTDLGAQRLEPLLEQRPEQHRHGDEIEEEPSCRSQALRGEGWQRPKLVGFLQLAQQPTPKSSPEIPRLPPPGAPH